MEIEVSVVIPVYRSATSLPHLVQRLLRVLNNTKRRFEIIFVDDGSPDNSWEVLRQLRASYPEEISIIELMRNFGQHNALMCGFRHARGKYIITMDDDLQNPPEEIPKLLDSIESTGVDLVYGVFETKKHHPLRNIGSALVIAFFKFAFQCSIQGTSFRIIRRELVESIFTYSLNFTYIDGLLAWNTQRIGTVPVAHHTRSGGRVATPKAGADLEAKTLLSACRERLPLYMVPAKVEIRTGPLPRNPNGKIDRKLLSVELHDTYQNTI